jgi:aspartate/methionine/tyrosine aminotransferase
MRLGYLALPASLVGAFRQAKRLTDRHAPVLEQRVLTSLIDSGTYERHVRRIRRERTPPRGPAGRDRALDARRNARGRVCGRLARRGLAAEIDDVAALLEGA